MSYTLNNYRTKQFQDKFFITTDHGSYAILTKKEFLNLKSNKIDDALRVKLEEKEIILSNNNITEAIRLTRSRYSFLSRGTSLHIIVPTLRCNLSCIYCHASSRPENEKSFDMNQETAKKTVDFIFQTPNKAITIEFQGGEPLLNWDIVKFIICYAREKNKVAKKKLLLTIVSNLSLMDDDKLTFLLDNNVTICTSFDGPKELHDYNRPYSKGSNYDHLVKWVKKIKAATKEDKCHALVTVTRKSLSMPKEIVDEYLKMGFASVHLRTLNKLGVAAKTWSKIGYNVDEFIKFWTEAADYIEQINKDGIKIYERMVGYKFKKINEEFDPNFLDLRSPCGAAIGQLAYNYNGDVYTCDEARMIEDDLFLLGNVKTHSQKELVTGDEACAVVSASINDQYVCDNCVYKPYCGVCPVCNYAAYGSLLGNVGRSDHCKIHKAQFDWVVKNIFLK